MSQRGTSAMILFFLAALVALGDTAYKFIGGHGLSWRGVLIGLCAVAAGIHFRSAKDPV